MKGVISLITGIVDLIGTDTIIISLFLISSSFEREVVRDETSTSNPSSSNIFLKRPPSLPVPPIIPTTVT
ncbi:MAG: hypothetical protein AN188_00988 [Candidatus Methanofastidiosum methylothiophilum]|uniref:Uncharacterized protein n=1 Tax=Candidatus Methanofastidiosum methylothiophilum TaxID=1705564 RepID=A0A150JBI8_9EURY|nr:MAG: hypothetical protein AN188_00988 [Candidatus Methanofastidiosum methylthiophilus]